MAKGRYIFVPDTEDWWKPQELKDIPTFLGLREGSWGRAIDSFFSDETIKSLVVGEHWQEVFNIWEHYSNSDDHDRERFGEDFHYTADVLAAFLWLLNIDFMLDLTDEYINGSVCSISSCDIQER